MHILPIVVVFQKGTSPCKEPEHWITQRIWHLELGQCWAKGTYQYFLRLCAADDEATDGDLSPGEHLCACGDVLQHPAGRQTVENICGPGTAGGIISLVAVNSNGHTVLAPCSYDDSVTRDPDRGAEG